MAGELFACVARRAQRGSDEEVHCQGAADPDYTPNDM
jgi:hypothetical protein